MPQRRTARDTLLALGGAVAITLTMAVPAGAGTPNTTTVGASAGAGAVSTGTPADAPAAVTVENTAVGHRLVYIRPGSKRATLTAPPGQGATIQAGPVLVAGEIPLSWDYPQTVELTSQRMQIASATPGMARDGEIISFSANVRSTTIDGLTPDRGYRFRIRGVNGDGLGRWGPWLNTNSRSVAPATARITRALVTPETPRTVDLQWLYPPAAPNLTSQRISITGPNGAARNGEIITLAPNVNQYDVDRLDPDTVYQFRVRGVNTYATGNWSAPVWAGPPATPSDVFFSLDSVGNNDITWTYPDNAPDPTSWRVRIDDGDTSETYVVPGRRSSFTLDNPTPWAGNPTAQVRAVNGLTSSKWSPKATLTVYQPPGQVTGLNCQSSPGGGQCNWNPVAGTKTAPVQDYLVYRDGKLVDQTSATSDTFANLTNGRNYDITVAARGPGGVGPTSSISVLTPATVPGVVGDVTASGATGDGFTVTWTAPVDDGGSAIESYRVTVDGPGNVNVNVNELTATVTGAEPASSYIVTVVAVNRVGAGPEASDAIITLPDAPATINATIDEETATIVWSNVEGNISGYNVYRCQATQPDGCQPDQLIAQTTDTSYTDENLAHGRWWLWRVSAYTSGGVGPASDTVAVETTPSALPAAPEATWQNPNMLITWQATDGADDGYRIQRCTLPACASYDTLANTDQTSYLDTTVQAGGAYRWRVAGVNPSGDGAYSSVEYTTPASAPVGLTVDNTTASSITLSWQPPGDPVTPISYTVYACQGDNCQGTAIASDITDTGYTYSPLDAYSTWTFTVAAYNGSPAGQGPASAPADGTTEPAPPGDITLERGTETLQATWTGQSYADNYQIAWCQGPASCTPGEPQTVPNTGAGQPVSYTIDGLKPSNEYTVFVRTIAGTSQSAWTNASENTLDLDPPGNVTATGGNRSITAGFSQVPQADSYLLYLCAGSTCDPATAQPTTIARPQGDQVTYTWTSLGAATVYRFAAKAVDQGVESALSSIASATTDNPPPPPTPTPGSVQPVWSASSSGTATFTWAPATYASWYICNGQNTGSARECTIAGAADSQLTVNVQACNSSGCSTATVTSGWTNPAAVAGTAIASVTDTCITASWNGTAGATYRLRAVGGASEQTATVNGATGQVCGLKPDTAYSVTVAGVNRGNSAWTGPASGDTSAYTNPSAPGNVTFTMAGQPGGFGSNRCAAITWTGSVADNRYQIRVNNTAVAVVTGTTSTNVCNIAWNQTATFAVAGINRGNSAWTGPAGAAPGTFGATPAIPTGTVAATIDATENVTGGRISIRGFNSSGAGNYQIKRADAIAPWQDSGPPFVDSGLVWNTVYTYTVAACNTWGCSPYSSGVKGTSSPGPALFEASRNSDITKIDVNVSGAGVGGSKAYRIRYCNRDATPGCDPFSGQAVAWKTTNGVTVLTGLDRRSKYAIGVITSSSGDGQGALTYSVIRYVTTG